MAKDKLPGRDEDALQARELIEQAAVLLRRHESLARLSWMLEDMLPFFDESMAGEKGRATSSVFSIPELESYSKLDGEECNRQVTLESARQKR